MYVFYLLFKLNRLKILKIFILLTLIFSINNLIAYAIYFKNYLLFPYSRIYSGEKKLIECIKYEYNPSLLVLEKKCDFGSFFKYFQEKENLIHPSIKIKDRDEFSEKIFKTFGNKNQYIFSQK